MVPVKPRKSELGRFTHCTGSRKGASCMRSWSTSTASRYCMSVGPPYHGIASDASTMLSPRSADMGMSVTSSRPSCAANSPYSAAISAKRSSEKSTRSILFTATATWRMPSSHTR